MAKRPDRTADKTTPPITQKKDLYDEKVAPFLRDIRELRGRGITEGAICKQLGVGRTAWAEYKKKHPELNETLYRAREADKQALVDKAHQIANGYDYEETTEVKYYDKNGNLTGSKITTVTKHAKADGGMMQFLLINRYPSDFARDPQILELRREILELKKQMAEKTDDMEGV